MPLMWSIQTVVSTMTMGGRSRVRSRRNSLRSPAIGSCHEARGRWMGVGLDEETELGLNNGHFGGRSWVCMA